ncbi:MAG: tetratricopeptide repeat protein, partial [Planctomycetota bacterium]
MTSRLLHCALFAACCVMFLTPAHAQDAASTQTLNAANGLLNRQLYDLAANEYERFLREQPNHAKVGEARYGLGVSLYHVQRYDDAVKQLALLSADHAYAAEAATVLGQCYLRLGRYDAAADALDLVVTRHRTHDLFDDAAALQAEALYLAGAHERVGAAARNLVEGAGDSPRRERVELIWCLSDMARGDYRAATARLREMQSRFPDGAHADQTALLLAQCLHHQRNLPAALDLYRSVSRAARDEYVPDALYGLATVLYEQKQIAPAGDVLDELLSRFPDDEQARPGAILRGRVWLDLRKYDQAVKIFDQTLAAGGANLDEAAYWRAKCDLRQDRPAEAAKRLAAAIERYPKSTLMPEMLYDHAVALTRSGAPAEAVARLETLRKRFAKHALAADALHLMAVAEHDRERWEQSTAHCVAFLQKHGRHALAADVAFLYAENAYRGAAYEDAVTRFRDYLDTHPKTTRRDQAAFRLGMALYRLDRDTEAGRMLETIAGGANTPDEFRPALLALGDLAFRQQEWTEARRYLERYLDGGIDVAGVDDALLKLGLAHHRDGDPAGAIRSYETIITSMPSSPHHAQATFERGQALVELGRSDDAVRDFEQVVKAAPGSPLALHALNHLAAMDVARER